MIATIDALSTLKLSDNVDNASDLVAGRAGLPRRGAGVIGDEARERFTSARVARLATADASGAPHVVPMVFAVAGDVIYSAVDAKPKRTTALRRLANVHAN